MENKRPDWTTYYLNIAKAVSARSTCLRRKYGAIIVKDNVIISTGYNGSPRGDFNCCDVGVCERERLNVPKGQRYELCLAGETIIKLLDGTYKTIKELADSKSTNFWVYSIDTSTGKIVPALAENPRLTKKSAKVIKITFDNGESITCTPDHKILMRDCKYRQAKRLKKGDSVMPMYYNFARNNGYESICNTIVQKNYSTCNTHQIPTHQLVYNYFHPDDDLLKNDELVHHIDENKNNNTPDNLQKLSRSEHTRLHHNTEEDATRLLIVGEHGRELLAFRSKYDENFREQLRNRSHKTMSDNWNNPVWRENMKETQAKNGREIARRTNSDPRCISARQRGRVLAGLSLLRFKLQQSNSSVKVTKDNYIKLRKKYRTSGRGGLAIPMMNTIIKNFGGFTTAWEESANYNHKVVKVEKLKESIDVYDMTVPKYNNFAVDLGDNSCVFVHNCKAVHAEQNALINADPVKVKGATIYIYGENADGSLANGAPCLLCNRMLHNAQIHNVIYQSCQADLFEEFYD